jgi:hypothetical protein
MTTSLLVIKVDAEDYQDRTGKYALAIELVEKYGGKQVGGGTCFVTGISDIDIEVDIIELINLTAALDAFELTWLAYAD